jgi:hypothetical protein
VNAERRTMKFNGGSPRADNWQLTTDNFFLGISSKQF